jgi:GntR family transcriptional regulator
MIDFHVEARSGVPTYLQIVQQVRQAARLGVLRPGDQLPTVKEVVGSLAINPNTVLRAYRELDLEGVTALPADDVADLRGGMQRWVTKARGAGLDADDMGALFADAVRPRIARVA